MNSYKNDLNDFWESFFRKNNEKQILDKISTNKGIESVISKSLRDEIVFSEYPDLEGLSFFDRIKLKQGSRDSNSSFYDSVVRMKASESLYKTFLKPEKVKNLSGFYGAIFSNLKDYKSINLENYLTPKMIEPLSKEFSLKEGDRFLGKKDLDSIKLDKDELILKSNMDYAQSIAFKFATDENIVSALGKFSYFSENIERFKNIELFQFRKKLDDAKKEGNYNNILRTERYLKELELFNPLETYCELLFERNAK